MGTSFERLLAEALNQNFSNTSTHVNVDKFMNFLNALMMSADQSRINMALRRALELPLEQIASIIDQVQGVGSHAYLSNALHSDPTRVMIVTELAQKLLKPTDLSSVLANLAPATRTQTDDIDDIDDVDEDDDIDDVDEDDDIDDDIDNYNVEGDYYNQGEDSSGH